jgi:hypothetical protein
MLVIIKFKTVIWNTFGWVLDKEGKIVEKVGQHSQGDEQSQAKTRNQKVNFDVQDKLSSSPETLNGNKRPSTNSFTPARILSLQRTVGNRAVQRLLRNSLQAPVIQRAYINVAPDPRIKQEWKVRYEKTSNIPDKFYIVYLPTGFHPTMRDIICDKLGFPHENIQFTNEKHDGYYLSDKNPDKDLATPVLAVTKVNRAKQLINELINAKVQNNELKAELLKVLEIQTVEFPENWFDAAKGVGVTTKIAETEGITTTHLHGRGARRVLINQVNHTSPVIVHELFHALEHDKLTSGMNLSPYLEEGITEYFALLATGMNLRTTKNTAETETIYEEKVWVVKTAVDKGWVTLEQLMAAYFEGKLDQIEKLSQDYNDLLKEFRRTAM